MAEHCCKVPEGYSRQVGLTQYGTGKTFNIGSPQQRVSRLLEIGYKPTKFTKKGNPQIDEEALIEYAKESGIQEIQAIADWLVAFGRGNMVQDMA
jgi:hypothetical protein